MIRNDALNGEIRSLLDEVSARLSNETLTELVGQVVIDGRDVSTVAEDFLTANGFF